MAMIEVDKFIESYGDLWTTTLGIKNYTKLDSNVDEPIHMEVELYSNGLGSREDFQKWYALFQKMYPNSHFDIDLQEKPPYIVSIDIDADLSYPSEIKKLNLYEMDGQSLGLVHLIERTLTPTVITLRGEYILGIPILEITGKLPIACKILGLDAEFVKKVIYSVKDTVSISLASKGDFFGVYLLGPRDKNIVEFGKKYSYPSAIIQYVNDHLSDGMLDFVFEEGFYFKKGQTSLQPLRTGFYTNFSHARRKLNTKKLE
jgi:hypothetical protein